jgi:ubiquitin-conjugating enzyme E2 D
VRDGPYRGGIFKFDIIFSQNYPNKIPEVIFSSKILHPYIQESSGKLDLTVSNL